MNTKLQNIFFLDKDLYKYHTFNENKFIKIGQYIFGQGFYYQKHSKKKGGKKGKL